MPEKRINELFDVDDFSATSILHTQSQGAASDRKVTVQEILNLIPENAPEPPISQEPTIDPVNDNIAFTLDSDGHKLRRATVASLKTALDIQSLAFTGSMASGVFALGPMEVRIKATFSTTDSDETFTFDSPFTNTCLGVWPTRTSVNGATSDEASLVTKTITRTNFSMKRDGSIDGTIPFTYLAIGY